MNRMSDDLISRKELLDRLRGNVLVDVTPALEDAIENQPAAFDKKKVIEELRELHVNSKTSKNQCEFESTEDFDYMGAEVAYKTAIEIVKKGGIE